MFARFYSSNVINHLTHQSLGNEMKGLVPESTLGTVFSLAAG
jgi:hypothetical protein